jgi:hypothetical protein
MMMVMMLMLMLLMPLDDNFAGALWCGWHKRRVFVSSWSNPEGQCSYHYLLAVATPHKSPRPSNAGKGAQTPASTL